MLKSLNLSSLRDTLDTLRGSKNSTEQDAATQRLSQILLANADALLYLYEFHCKPPVLKDVLHDGVEFARSIQGYLYRCSCIVRQTEVARAMDCSTTYVNNLILRSPLRCKLSVVARLLTAIRRALNDKKDLIVDPDEFIHNIRYHVSLAILGISPEDLAKHCAMTPATIRRTLSTPHLMTMWRATSLINAAAAHRAQVAAGAPLVEELV